MWAEKVLEPLLLGIFLLTILFIQESQCSCLGQLTCADCISSTYSCVWCAQKNFTYARCQPRSTLENLGCNESFIQDPSYSMVKQQDEEVHDSTGEADDAVQIQPQHIKIKTRPRHKTHFSMIFKAANNFPVDLYFLYDISVSMKDAIKNLEKLADDIGQAIGDISSNYRMGYGVFQDKVILPFTDTSPGRIKNPCFMKKELRKNKCQPPFEYKHILEMTKNIKTFKNAINSTKLTANNDDPEGSLDAMMQAIMCKSAVGWRNGRKMLIFSSNGPFHSAGAGRLAGILTPNDGQCHLDESGDYVMQLMQDYPSVSQLTTTVKNNAVHVIFIVESQWLDLFKQLSKRVPDSTVEELGDQNDPQNQNIKNVIERKYKEIISEVEITHNNVTGVDVKIRANSKECEQRGTNKCKGLQIGSEIEFSVEVSVTECPKKKEDRKKMLILHPRSLKTDQLLIEIDIICDCDCSTNQDTWDTSNDVCTNGNGTLQCGICSCNEGRFGSKCECDGSESDTLDNNCINKDDNSSLPCSGRGSCKCGQCNCQEGYTGKYCQCNDKACKSFQGEICGGFRGICSCGKCICVEGYKGPACDCTTSNSTCIEDGSVCSDSGSCECGVCKCDTGYTGKFCSECFLCGDSACDIQDYKICAECALGERRGDHCMVECPQVELVDRLSDAGTSVCSLRQTDDCFLTYSTSIHEGNVTLHVQKTKTCSQPVDIIPIVAGVVAGVVVIGLLLLLLWKILTTVFDRIEYSKFQEDLKNCKWAKEDNPFYKGATTTYKNPLVDTGEPQE